MSENVFENQLDAVLTELRAFLLAKNESYGNSALSPIRIFSKASSEEQLRVRMDDKLSRLASGKDYGTDDTIKDLLGYLVLYRIAQKMTTASIYYKES